jgi:fused signal recognition particle receptor
MNLFRKSSINDQTFADLEDVLIMADFGASFAHELVCLAKKNMSKFDEENFIVCIKDGIRRFVGGKCKSIDFRHCRHCILFIGINGSGKTTSIAKIANIAVKHGRSVDIVACDTFRASATEQLEVWADKLGCKLYKSASNSDPSGLAYRAVTESVSDVVLIDTAGRMVVDANLMGEIKKIHRVIGKVSGAFSMETILVLDSTVGQNSIEQVRGFMESVNITGILLSKFDGNSKAGALVNILRNLDIPIIGVGTGESEDSFEHFDTEKFINRIFE